MGLTFEVPFSHIKPYFRYVNELMGCRCFADMIATGVFPDAKEITESAAAYAAVRKARVFDLRDPAVNVMAIADGCTPRTATMFAMRSAWQCHSVDPNLHIPRGEPPYYGVERLSLWPVRAEDMPELRFRKLVLVAVHSHADLSVACRKLTAAQRVVVAIPCCYKQERERPPDMDYNDIGIWSDKNRVMVWIDDGGK